jgi:hypothetical protein
MKEIKPTYVTFEQAKWLKEKGFNESCRMLINGAYEPFHLNLIETQYFQNNSVLLKDCYSAPEQHQVVDWLLEKHGIWVTVLLDREDKNTNKNKGFKAQIDYADGYVYCGTFEKPQEAYSAAFDYIKDNNLI